MTSKKNVFFVAFMVIAFFASFFTTSVAYAFFDSLMLTASGPSLNIGYGFWNTSYIFKDLDPIDFNTDGVWDVDTNEGFYSNNGNIYISNQKEEYTLRSTAQLSGDTVTHGTYWIYFESTLNASNKPNGYALVFSNIHANVRIVEVTNGVESQALLTYNNSTSPFLPGSSSDAAWRQLQEIEIQVSNTTTPGLKYLNVWYNSNQLVTDYIINGVSNAADNTTGYHTHPLETTLVQLDIEDYVSTIKTITFDSDGGSFVNSIRQEQGTAVNAPANPTKEGHTFVDWRLTGSTYVFSTMPNNDITLIANWQVIQYTINFDSNGGSSVSAITQDYGTNVSAPTNPTLAGHSFDGWFEDEALTIPYVFTTIASENITLYAGWTINDYTITFDTDGGTAVNSITQNYNTAVVQPTNPTKDGYTFVEWTHNSSPYTFSTMPASNITLLATWDLVPLGDYTITFDSNGGSAVTSIVETEGNVINAPADPSLTGYSFAGWFEDAGLTTAYTFTTMPSANITLYADWTINQYTITFDSNGGSAVGSITQDYNTAVTRPTNPTRAGYIFLDWTYNSNPYSFTTMPDANITVIANWEQILSYTITFASNGGSAVADIVENNGESISAPTDPTRTGYTFAGWHTDMTFTTLYVFDTMPNYDFTLYADWTINQYTINFITNGGSAISPITQPYGTVVNEPTNPIRVGNFDFAGWYSDAALSVPYTFTNMPANNVNVFADWASTGLTYELINGGTSYRITGNTSQNSLIQIPQEYNGLPITEIGADAFNGNTYMQSINIPTSITTIGANAFRSATGLQEIFIPITVTTIGGNAFNGDGGLTINAEASSAPGGWNWLWNWNGGTVNWGVSFVPNLLFNVNGGSNISPISQTAGTSITAPADPTKPGHSFVGWFSDEALITPYTFNLMPASNTIVFAKWTINQYTITFDSNGGSAISSITQDYGTSVIAPTNPTLDGYAFIEWTLSGSTYNFTTMPDANITLVANWQEIVAGEYTISFDSNGGTTVTPIIETEGNAISAPVDPTRYGYTFDNWYTDAGLTTAYTFSIMPSNDLTLYAGWIMDLYTITFNSNGGSAVTPIVDGVGVAISAPVNPIRTGYTFEGWYTDAKLKNYYTFSVMPEYDFTLYADWGTTGLVYQALGGTGYSVTGNTSTNANVQIPQRHLGLPVTEIAASAFENNAYMTSVNIPYTVTTIGNYAFRNSQLQQVFIPINVVTMGSQVFAGSPMTIYAEATSTPSGWNFFWNFWTGITVNWGTPDN